MKEITIGFKTQKSRIIDESMLACNMGSGELEVFATPSMVALMENAAAACLKEFLDEGETSVGTYLEINHTSATPNGLTVSASAEVTAVNGREVTFSVAASDGTGSIGEGVHKRFVVNSEKFIKKALSKKNV